MNERERNRLLKENGFWLKREAKSGDIFTDGNSTVMAPKPMARASVRSERNFLADMKRAMDIRPPKPGLTKPEEPKKEENVRTESVRVTAVETPKKSFATLGDALKGAQVSVKPVEKAADKPVPAKPTSEDEAAEYAKNRRSEGATYTEIGRELTELGYRQGGGQLPGDAHVNHIVLTRWPEMRRNKPRSATQSVKTQIIHVNSNQQKAAPVADESMASIMDIIKAIKKLDKLTEEDRRHIISILVEAI